MWRRVLMSRLKKKYNLRFVCSEMRLDVFQFFIRFGLFVRVCAKLWHAPELKTRCRFSFITIVTEID